MVGLSVPVTPHNLSIVFIDKLRGVTGTLFNLNYLPILRKNLYNGSTYIFFAQIQTFFCKIQAIYAILV